jgi:hypothetical protein
VTGGQTEGGAEDGTGDEAVAVGETETVETIEADNQPQPGEEARELHPTVD